MIAKDGHWKPRDRFSGPCGRERSLENPTYTALFMLAEDWVLLSLSGHPSR